MCKKDIFVVVRPVGDIRMIVVLYDVHFHLSILEALAVHLSFLILVCVCACMRACVYVVQSVFNFTISAKRFGDCPSITETNNVQSLTSSIILTFSVINFSYA